MEFSDIKLPEGWHIQKSGGRPRKDPKFVAITLARAWWINQRKEKASTADRWIMEKFGISDEAHIRSIVRRMINGINTDRMSPLFKTVQLHSDEMALAMSTVRQKGWLWQEGLIEAIPLVGSIVMTQDASEPGSVRFDVDLKSPD